MTPMERLRSAVERIRVRTQRPEAERWLMIGGAVLLVLGLGVIGLAWFGASHTPFVFEQIPYLISGGVLGLALVFAGGFLYFAYWLTRMVRDVRGQSREMNHLLNEIAELIAAALRSGAGQAGTSQAGSQNGSFVATQNGTMFHRSDCAIVARRQDLRPVSGKEAGMEPCKMCDPLGGEAAPTTAEFRP
jgi:hypothetical protein